MKYYLHYLIIVCLLSGCGVLPNGITYKGEQKVFHRAIGNSQTMYRAAQGRELGWELGIAFMALANGRINGLHIKNPTKGVVPITIWDADTKQIIQQFNATLNGTDNYQPIFMHQATPIKAGKTYCITINVIQYFYQVQPFNPFPILGTNVELLGSVFEEAHYTRFPQFYVYHVYHGLIDVDLQWLT